MVGGFGGHSAPEQRNQKSCPYDRGLGCENLFRRMLFWKESAARRKPFLFNSFDRAE